MIIYKGPRTLTERQKRTRNRRMLKSLIILIWVAFVLAMVWMLVGFNPPVPWSFQN